MELLAFYLKVDKKHREVADDDEMQQGSLVEPILFLQFHDFQGSHT